MRLDTTSIFVGVLAFAVLLVSSLTTPADAKSRRQQRIEADQSYSHGVTVWPRYTPREYVVCWNGCNNPGTTIVMGADPDPFIRQQILRDASGFFGNGGR